MREMNIENDWYFDSAEPEISNEERALFLRDVQRAGKEDPEAVLVYTEVKYGVEN